MWKRPLLPLLMALMPSLALGQTVTCDRFEPQATLEGSQLTVSLDTDLPDSTVVMVSVSRSYWAGTPLQEYPIDYLESRSTVGEWRKPRVVSVDHAVWRRKLDERVRLLAAAGEPVKVVRPDADVAVSFTVPVNQADPRFGAGNRNLVGKKVATTGLRVVWAERKVSHPFGTVAQPAPAEFGSPDGLVRGLKYRLSRDTPLAPERHPADPLRATALIRHVPAGTIVTVLGVDRSDASNPWYRVSAASASGGDLGTGWVNSVALIGQELKVVRL